jgi:hypothetical protein
MWNWLWWVNPRNWLGETWKRESGRRIEALEVHIQDLEERYAALENRLNVALEEEHVLTDHDAGFGGQDITYRVTGQPEEPE